MCACVCVQLPFLTACNLIKLFKFKLDVRCVCLCTPVRKRNNLTRINTFAKHIYCNFCMREKSEEENFKWVREKNDKQFIWAARRHILQTVKTTYGILSAKYLPCQLSSGGWFVGEEAKKKWYRRKGAKIGFWCVLVHVSN